MKLNLKFNEMTSDLNLNFDKGQKLNLDLDFQSAIDLWEKYAGSYVVVPQEEDMVLPTANKLMINDLVIKAISGIVKSVNHILPDEYGNVDTLVESDFANIAFTGNVNDLIFENVIMVLDGGMAGDI